MWGNQHGDHNRLRRSPAKHLHVVFPGAPPQPDRRPHRRTAGLHRLHLTPLHGAADPVSTCAALGRRSSGTRPTAGAGSVPSPASGRGEQVTGPSRQVTEVTLTSRSWTGPPRSAPRSGRRRSCGAADDPMLCGGCAVGRGLRVLDLAVTGPSPRVLARAVQAATPVTDRSPHPCRSTRSPAEATRSAPLLPPIDQCGYLPFPLQPLSPHSLSRRVRDLLEGDLGAHRDLPVDADEEPAGPRRRAARSPCRGVARTAEPTGRQPCTGGTPTTLRWPVSRMY